MNASANPTVSDSVQPDTDEGQDCRAAVNVFKTFFSTLNKNNLHSLSDVFSDDIVFVDPFHEVHGLADVTEYYASLYENIDSIQFDFQEDIVQGNQAVITWTMTYRHPRLKAGGDIMVEGVSKLRFRGDHVVHHRDYFDAGELLYENVPLLGWAINKIKQRL